MLFKNISDKNLFPGINIYETSFIKRNSAITLPGIGIFIHKNIKGLYRLRMLQHEYGHFLDYKINFKSQNSFSSLLRFYIKIGLPSIFNVVKGIGGTHKHYHTEIRANQLASNWFGKNLAEGFSRQYPIV